MDTKSFTVGALVGAIAWEISKHGIAYVLKRGYDAAESKRKLLRDDIEDLSGLVLSINEASLTYYAADYSSDEAKSLSANIKAKSKTAGIKLHALNTQLSSAGRDTIPIQKLLALRNAATRHLDVARAAAWKDDDPRLNEIHRAAHHLHTELNKARFGAT